MEKNIWQVKLFIFEARNLGWFDYHPVCGASILNSSEYTQPCKSTANPIWNHSMLLSVSATSAKFFSSALNIVVYNARTLRPNSVIAQGSINLGWLHGRPDHCILNQWLPLNSQTGHGNSKGFVRISACIVIPGSTLMDLSTPYINDAGNSSVLEVDTITRNNIQVFCHVYRAEDLPRMDVGVGGAIKDKWQQMFTSRKEERGLTDLVDPCLQVTLAAKTLTTSVVKRSDHPVWNETLMIEFQVPSFTDMTKFELLDWDRASRDDLIATSYLRLQEICDQGLHGCLPCFGPCYLNFYGSEREFNANNVAAEAMNQGRRTGAAYRGRVLLHINSQPASKVTSQVKQCSPNIRFLQPYTAKNEYRLIAVFMSASLSRKVSVPVVYEISIGNYGNSLDRNVVTSSSTTAPLYPASAGSSSTCWYMPWGSRKPCSVVDCLWEDCEHRIKCANCILRLCSSIEVALQDLETKVGIHCDLNVVTKLVVTLLEKISNELKDLEVELDMYSNKESCAHNQLDGLTLLRRRAAIGQLLSQIKDVLQTATLVEDTIDEINELKRDIESLCRDPQMSIPDVIITLLLSNQRLAYCRIPAHEIFYTQNKKSRGRFCNISHIYNLKEPGVDVQSVASVRCRLWLGRKSSYKSWIDRQNEEGQIGVFAECYENQKRQGGGWVAEGLPVYAWSDAQGKVSLHKENFILPDKWKWSGQWNIVIDSCGTLGEVKPPVTEIIYKWQERTGDSWKSAATWYTDMELKPLTGGMESVKLLPHWKWKTDWKVDRRMSTDSNGWEYCNDVRTLRFTHIVKKTHKVQRVRLSRTRTFHPPAKSVKKDEKVESGWQYAISYPENFHYPQRSGDKLRRRLWTRKLSCLDSNADLLLFDVKSNASTPQNKPPSINKAAPRLYLAYSHCYEYELRAYIYKAKGVLAGDASGLSDVFVRVHILDHAKQTKTVDSTLSPCWDESLLFSDIQLYGLPNLHMVREPVSVLVQLFDQDEQYSEEFLGEFTVTPYMRLSTSISDDKKTSLRWFTLSYAQKSGGQLLAAFELYLKDKRHPLLPPALTSGHYSIPRHLKPQLQSAHIELLSWGLRLLPNSRLKLGTPAIEFDCDGSLLRTNSLTKANKTLNFDGRPLIFKTQLSVDTAYISPLTVKLVQDSSTKKPQYLATCEIRNLTSFLYGLKSTAYTAPVVTSDDMRVSVAPSKLSRHNRHKYEFDWWSKFFASCGEVGKCGEYLRAGSPGGLLKVYSSELEKVTPFEQFQDLLISFPLKSGKAIGEESQTTVACLKGNLKVHTLGEDTKSCKPRYFFTNLPSRDEIRCLLRLYIVRAIGLQPSDPNGLADPYILAEMPGFSTDNRKEYLANTLDPVFGRMFEMRCTIPQMSRLCIKVMDRDIGSADDLIGETSIDVENRLITRHRGQCGLSQMYITSGIYQWRDSKRPTEILEEYTRVNNLLPPKYFADAGLKLASTLYNIIDFEKDHRMAASHFGDVRERLALHILNKLALVPEHVETRALYCPAQPGVEQGKLQMWLDIFPEDEGAPGEPVDITPRKPQRHEVRVIIHGTEHVKPADKSLFGNSNDTTDVYIKCWIKGTGDVQETDVHYNAEQGEASFNWRFVFPIEYFSSEQAIVVTQKKTFSINEIKRLLPPTLAVQVWDTDTITADDFIGALEIRMDQMKLPLKELPYFKARFESRYAKREVVDLFEHKSVRGYFPVYGTNVKNNSTEVTGKVEMTVEILTEEESQARPVGKGREPPQALPQPLRSSDSFPWYQNPWKASLIFLRKRRNGCLCCLCLCLVLVIFLLFLLALPRVLLEKLAASTKEKEPKGAVKNS